MWAAPYGKRATMMILFNIFQTVGFYGFANWVPTLLIKQGITLTNSLMYSSIIAIAAPIGPMIGLFIADKFERRRGDRGGRGGHPGVWADLQPSLGWGASDHDGRRPDAREQYDVLQLSRLSDRTLPYQHPSERGGLCVLLEPFVGDFHLVYHRRLAEGNLARPACLCSLR